MAFTSPYAEKRPANTYLSGTRRSEIEPKSGPEGARRTVRDKDQLCGPRPYFLKIGTIFSA